MIGIVFHRAGLDVFRLALSPSDPEIITSFRLNQVGLSDFEDGIRAAIGNDDFELAGALIETAQSQGYQISEELIEAANPGLLAIAERNALDAIEGAFTGEFSNSAGLIGAVTSDLSGVGDVRDVIIQGSAALQDEEYDPVILGLAAAGIALTVGTIFTASAAAPADTGVSVLKNAYRADRMSGPLRTHLRRVGGDVVDLTELRRVMDDISVRNIDRSRAQLATIIRRDELLEVERLASSMRRIGDNSGLRTSFEVMRYAENGEDLTKFRRLSGTYGAQLLAVTVLLGKGAITLGSLSFLIGSWIIFALVWITSTSISIGMVCRKAWKWNKRRRLIKLSSDV